MACDRVTWQAGVFRAREILFVISAPLMIVSYLYFVRTLPCRTMHSTAAWMPFVLVEWLFFAAVLASWASGIPCFWSNCAAKECDGYTASAWTWIGVFSFALLLYGPGRYLNVLGGLVNRKVVLVKDGELPLLAMKK